MPGASPEEVESQITKVIEDNLSRVIEQQATPKEVLQDAAAEVQGLLPRN